MPPNPHATAVIYQNLIRITSEGDIPFFLRKKQGNFRQCVEELAVDDTTSDFLHALTLLLALYKAVNGWLAVENYIEQQSKIMHHTDK